MSSDPDALSARKAAIEDELRARLARDRAPSVSASPLASVALVCLECRGWNSADASFCVKCGMRFNALVVASAPAPAPKASE